MKLAASANRKVKLQKRSQLFIRTHNEALAVVAMRVPDEDRVPLVRVQERDERVHDVSRDDHLIRRQAGLLGIGDGDVDPLNRVLDEIVEDLDRAGP